MSKFMIEDAQIQKASSFQPIVSDNTPEIVNIASTLGKVAEWHDEISAIKDGTNIDSFGDVETALSGKLNTSDVDTALSSTSTNPVQNKVVQAPVARLVNAGSKNLLKITRPSQTINGVTFTVNDDGTVSVNGTNNTSSAAVFYLDILPADTAPNYNGCRLTGCPSGGSASTYRIGLQLNSGSYTNYASDIGGGSPIRNVPSSDCRVAIIIYAGVTASNMIFKPMICTAEDYAISPNFVPYAKSNYELTQYVEPIPSLVDKGAKNIFDINAENTAYHATYAVSGQDITVTSNGNYARVAIPVHAKAGSYKFSCFVGYSSGSVDIRFAQNADSSGTIADKITVSTTGNVSRDFKLGTDMDFYIVLYTNTTSSSASNVIVFRNIMICSAADYAVSTAFTPYAPTNRELFETKADKSIVGLKLVAFDTLSSSSTYTYTMDMNDFIESSPDLARSVGTYIISVMTWSTSPKYSLYAVSYTGGTFNYTTITKIAGADMSITVASGVISVSGLPTNGGKISIHALL